MPSTVTASIETGATPAQVLDVLADASHLRQWAPGFADAVTGDAETGWCVTKDDRSFPLRVVVNDRAGTVDYLRDLAPGRVGGAYLRAIPSPQGGSVTTMTMPVLPELGLADSAAVLQSEIANLGQLLSSLDS